jgi:cytochrome c biogenesis protein CcmG/thiol:disulfide interchange protein DsbE
MRFAARRRLAAGLAPALCVVVAAGCGSGEPAPPAGRAELGGKPPRAPELRRLEAEANRLLDGGSDAFRRRLADLRGHPVVVNQWASWCTSCRYEFPFFQRLAGEYRGRVAFLGVDSQDNRADAGQFLKEFPTPFPHYFDPDLEIARLFGGGRAWPTTAYYDPGGKLVRTHLGAFASQAKLEEEIRRYALRG